MNYTLWQWFRRLVSGRPHMVVSGYEEGSEPAPIPYLLRWYLIPRNRWFNVYLHGFMRDDDDRALHDHPWPSLSILLRGTLWEATPGRVTETGRSLHWAPIVAPAVKYRSATYRHRLELVEGRPAWTLFITGPKVRKWGFWCGDDGKRFVPWEQFTAADDPGKIGRGCAE